MGSNLSKPLVQYTKEDVCGFVAAKDPIYEGPANLLRKNNIDGSKFVFDFILF